jgi:hypothetical protein
MYKDLGVYITHVRATQSKTSTAVDENLIYSLRGLIIGVVFSKDINSLVSRRLAIEVSLHSLGEKYRGICVLRQPSTLEGDNFQRTSLQQLGTEYKQC